MNVDGYGMYVDVCVYVCTCCRDVYTSRRNTREYIIIIKCVCVCRLVASKSVYVLFPCIAKEQMLHKNKG